METRLARPWEDTSALSLDYAAIGRLVALGGMLAVALSTFAHVSTDVMSVSAIVATGLSLLFGHLFGRIGAVRLGQAALGGAIVGFAPAALGIAAGVLFGDQSLAALAGCMSGAIAGSLGALLARGVHGF